MEMMHLFAIAILALIAGNLFKFFYTKVLAKLPQVLQTVESKTALITGAFLLLVIFAAHLVTRVLPRQLRA